MSYAAAWFTPKMLPDSFHSVELAMSPKRIARILAWIGSVVLVAVLVVAIKVVRHRSAKQELANNAATVSDALLHAHNFHWTQMKGDESQWVLRAKDASYAADKTSLVLSGADLSLIAKDGKSFELFAPAALLKLNGNHVSSAVLSGGLVVHYGDFLLTTPEAKFSPDNDQLEASGVVKIQGQGLTVTGIGMSGHPKAELFELLRQVSTEIVPRHKGAASKLS
jgi:LPS export ABC transporter protein LptC